MIQQRVRAGRVLLKNETENNYLPLYLVISNVLKTTIYAYILCHVIKVIKNST